ncbi:uncharacterized protein SPPG_04449 [Spizellomyces punctatus DAOM BR117]|uniref:Late embryogenesis abundant protein LEA-2 subgroup domain-containing protein n=1 Tax=Spizellomyces punctatus (strain DAOM BR117) TaxID=645134 RepID=A0A0L0HGG8_SPIPD|nr:uncharacterized protein SPPG_04449 [Spizellomyces punctatus DAOM BR117]KND00107.1 hypothetical protein SPPG_04449 [Spizellomyces punctatus DAOM BR117]|eukprot:XP_016608146.1 hypothetical protein SPPG_04449 [Spizellomyces punctatus DAOM BR117]
MSATPYHNGYDQPMPEHSHMQYGYGQPMAEPSHMQYSGAPQHTYPQQQQHSSMPEHVYRDSLQPANSSETLADPWYNQNAERSAPQPYDVEAYSSADKRKRRVCCCFPTRKSCCLTFCLIFLVILIILGVLVWYFWPTIPEYGYVGPYEPTSTAQFVHLAPGSEWKPGPDIPLVKSGITLTSLAGNFAFSYGMGVDVWLNNKNRFDIAMDRLDVVGRVKGENGQFIDAKNFKLQINMVNVNFPKNANTTEHVPLDLRYNATFSQIIGQKDPFLQLLATSCQSSFLGISPSSPNAIPLTMEFAVNVAPTAVRRLGITINTTIGPFDMACPAQLKDQLKQVDTLTRGLLNGALNSITG